LLEGQPKLTLLLGLNLDRPQGRHDDDDWASQPLAPAK